MILNDRAVKFHPKSPMIGLVKRTPMLGGPSPNALGPSFSGDCGIPGTMAQFVQWQSEHRYAGIDRLENLRVNVDSFLPSTLYDGRAYSVEKQKRAYFAALFPYDRVDDWDTLYKGDIRDVNSNKITRPDPVEVMRKFVGCVGGGILTGVERNSSHEVMNGEHVNLSEYAKSMLERHGKVGDLKTVR